jgi:pimeloyl-ACP methyl ester carboxylesterase
MSPQITIGGAVLDGVRTRTLSVTGEGPPILLLHGFTDSADSWRPLLAQLAALGRCAVAVDLPGSGKADALAGPAHLHRLDAFTAAFVEAYADDEPALLAGNSLGGLLAMRAGTRGDLRLAAVAGIGPAGLRYGRRLIRFERGVRRLAPVLGMVYRLPIPARLIRRGAECLYEKRLAQGLADPSLARRYASHIDGTRSLRRLLADLLTLADDEAADRLAPANIRVPVLLIWGGRDQLASVTGAPALLDAVPVSRLVVFDECGHCPQIQRPAEIAALLAGLPASAGREAVTA